MSTAIKFFFSLGAAAFNPHLNCLAPIAMRFTHESVQPLIILPGCLECHRADQCGMIQKLGKRFASNCIDCHMPVEPSNLLVLDADDSRLRANVRNHWIRVYQKTSPHEYFLGPA